MCLIQMFPDPNAATLRKNRRTSLQSGQSDDLIHMIIPDYITILAVDQIFALFDFWREIDGKDVRTGSQAIELSSTLPAFQCAHTRNSPTRVQQSGQCNKVE